MVRIKTFCGKHSLIDGEVSDWLEDHVGIIFIDLNYKASIQGSQLILTYVEGKYPSRFRKDVQASEVYLDLEEEDTPRTLGSLLIQWHIQNPDRIPVRVLSSIQGTEPLSGDSLFIFHEAKPAVQA